MFQNHEYIVCRPGGLALTEEALSYVHAQPGCTVLDMGCGNGATLKYIKDKYDASTYGVDISRKACEAAAKLLGSDYISLTSAEALAFPDNFFDIVLMECTITLFNKPEAALAEAFRVLKKDGALIISAPSITDSRKISDAGYAMGQSGNPPPASAKDSDKALISGGCIHINRLKDRLNELGFLSVNIKDCRKELTGFVASAILNYGSISAYAQAMEEASGGAILRDIPGKEASYSLITARK